MTKFYRFLLLFIVSIFSLSYSNAQTAVTAATAINNVCTGGGYVSVGTITISETVMSDFTSGTGLTYIISPPANFEFNPGATPVVTETGNGISAIVASAPVAGSFTVTFDVSAGSSSGMPLDALIINGLQVRAITGATTGNIVRSGGTAVQASNAVADLKNHCTLTALSAMAITGNPIDQQVCVNDDPTFTVTATGSNLTYLWERFNGSVWTDVTTIGGGAYSNGNTATMTVNDAQTTQDGFLFRCTVSSSCGGPAVTTNAELKVGTTASTTNPSNQTICSGGNATFSVTGTNAVSYQWQENNVNINDGGVYSGATTNTLTLTGVTTAMGMSGRTYRCVVSGACGTPATSAGRTLTVNATTTITTQPPAITNGCLSNNVNISVVATGTSLTYTWRRYNTGNGSPSWNDAGPISGGTAYSNAYTATMTANTLQASQNGFLFTCIISGACGTISSDTSTLAVQSTSTVNYFGLSSTYCKNAATDTLDGFPIGGVFSGPGMTDIGGGKGIFNPLTAGSAGTKAIVYTFGCAVSKNATLYDTTNIAYTSPAASSPSYPSSDPPVDLVVENVPPSGTLSGTFSGSGVSGTKFYPNLVSPGVTYPITFSFTNVNGCVSKVIKPITVTSPTLGVPQLRNNGVAFCQNGPDILLSDTSVDGPTPTWDANFYFAGFAGTGITNLGGGVYKFSPTTVGTYTILYRVNIDFGFFVITSTYASQSVTVNAPSTIDFTLPTEACRTSGTIDMAPFPNILSGGVGTGMSIFSSSPGPIPAGLLTGANNTFFDPSASGLSSTIHTVRYTFVNGLGCTTVLDKQINVFPKPPQPTLYAPDGFWAPQNAEYCYGSGTQYVGAVYSFTTSYEWYNNVSLAPASKISTAYYMPPQFSDNQPGTYTYYVTQTIGGCTSDPLPVTVKINDRAVITTGPAQTICEGSTITLAGTSHLVVASGTPVPATWSSPSLGGFSPSATTLNAIYTPTATDRANQFVDLTLTSNDPDGISGPCPVASGTVRMFINKAASVDAGLPKTFCSNSLVSLTGTLGGSTSFTTWTGPAGTTNIASPSALLTTYTPTGADKLGSALNFILKSNDPDGTGPCNAAQDTVLITINPEPTVEAGPDQTVCRSGSTVVNITGASRGGGSNSAIWSGGLGGFGGYTSTSTNLNAIYTPVSGEIPVNGGFANSIKLYLTSDDPDGAGPTGPCGTAKDSMLVIINPLPRIDSVIVPDIEFCKTDALFQIRNVAFTKYGVKTEKYLDPVVVNTGISGSNFIPTIANPGPHTIRYELTDNNNCYNFRDTSIYVYKVPNPKMDIDYFCATAPTSFSGKPSDFPLVANDNDNVSNINSYKWKFGDFNNGLQDTSSLDSTSYTYPSTLNLSAKQIYTVRLTVGTDKGCSSFKDSTITIGNIPAADFAWTGICPVDITNFTDLSNFPIAEVANYTWNFDTESTASGSTLAYKNRSYKFVGTGPTNTGAYDVKFKISSKIGCVDSITHVVKILDQYTPTPTDPYARNFAVTDAFWAVDGQNPSWQWGVTNKSNLTTGARKVWATDTLGTYNVSEKSYLNGPCLNMTSLTKPMVTLKIWSATQNQIAGTVLQSSTDGGATWKVIGDMSSGVNWYDNFGILGNPGNQPVNQFGWTGQHNGWKVAKIGLSNLKNLASVRLRLAFGSGQDTLNLTSGFAIDSIWVGERDKLLLIENFTNSTSTASGTADAALNTLVTPTRDGDVVAIHYHTGFPGSDPMNARNQADASSRVLYYGVTGVPSKTFEGNYNFGTALDTVDIDRRSLDPAKFNIKLTTTVNPTSVVADAKITAKDSVKNDFVVHLVVIERTVVSGAVGYQWVMTKMLPNASGTFFTQNFFKGDVVSLSETWNFSVPGQVYDPAQVGVIAFIQDVSTREVLQTAYVLGTGTTATGLKNELLAGKELFVYPNPADHTANILLGEDSHEEYSYSVCDELGQVVAEGIIESGSNALILQTSGFAGGLYVIRVGNSTDGFAYKKLMVTH